MKLVVTGGGTGGHIYPALSVALLLGPEQVDYVGGAGGPEARLAVEAGFRFHGIPTAKLSHTPGIRSLAAVGTATRGVLASLALLRRLRPDAVFGTGGYASGPVVAGAALLGIPTLILEGNAVPGRTNLWLSRLVRRIAVTYEAARPFFPARKVVTTGFPIRPDIAAGDPSRARSEFGLDSRPLLFVFGGSLGARSINRAVEEALPLLEPLGIQVLHQTGRSSTSEAVPPAGGTMRVPAPEWYHAVPYVERMADALAAAAVVVCRCGSSTLAEVAAAGAPALLIPYPHAYADHQTHNARALVEAGGAVVLADADLTGERLAWEVRALFEDASRRESMGRASRELARPDAARQIVAELESLLPAGRGAMAAQGVKETHG